MSKTPVVIQNTGAWYSQELARVLAAASKVADAAAASTKVAIAQAKRDIAAALDKEFPSFAKEFSESYGQRDEIDADWSAGSRGLRLVIDLDKRTDCPAAKILAAFRKQKSASDDLCSERCRLRNENSTADINRFKSRVRALYPHPTEDQCRLVFNEMVRPPKEKHTCPLRIRAA